MGDNRGKEGGSLEEPFNNFKVPLPLKNSRKKTVKPSTGEDSVDGRQRARSMKFSLRGQPKLLIDPLTVEKRSNDVAGNANAELVKVDFDVLDKVVREALEKIRVDAQMGHEEVGEIGN